MAKGGEGAVVDEDTLSRHCNCSADELAETLKLLSRRDLIETVDGCFRFQVEMIRRWFERSG
jgi:redox-regulated HSP33 family molecular chaperone